MLDYDKALELAKDYNSEPILDLISWSENYSWRDPSNPLVAFYAIVGLSLWDREHDYDIKPNTAYGYVEISKLAQALECYATRPLDVQNYLAELAEMEQSMG